MDLFATDRDRLAFLLETNAALDLDFEALEAQAEASAEEPSPEQRPKYITNYIGSKQKLVDWIWRHTPEEVESVVDAFSGSAVVAYMYKTKGLRVLRISGTVEHETLPLLLTIKMGEIFEADHEIGCMVRVVIPYSWHGQSGAHCRSGVSASHGAF